MNKEIREELDFVASLEDKGKRLDLFVQEFIEGATKSYIQKIIGSGGVLVKGEVVTKCGLKLKGNEDIIVMIPEDEILDVLPEDIPISIIYEDEYMVIINKDPNMVVHPAQGNYTGTLVNAVMFHIKDLSSINGVVRPGIVHRLDKDTSGIIIIAKNDKAHIKLVEMFKEKNLEKVYICMTKGNFNRKKGRIETLIGRDSKDRKKMSVVEANGKNAISNYEVLHETNGFSLVRVQIETGRTHQIRVHMKHLNHPIVGDDVYGRRLEKETAKRQMLHSYKLVFNHPITGEELKIFAPIPEDMRKVARNLGLDIEMVKE